MPKNVFGKELEPCSLEPLTGFLRNGKCEACDHDHAQHTVCVVLTEAFLEYSKAMGNDLSTPRPEYDFEGLKAGDQWCVCLGRWVEAQRAGVAPKIRLEATDISVVELVPIEELHEYAVEDVPIAN